MAAILRTTDRKTQTEYWTLGFNTLYYYNKLMFLTRKDNRVELLHMATHYWSAMWWLFGYMICSLELMNQIKYILILPFLLKWKSTLSDADVEKTEMLHFNHNEMHDTRVEWRI